METLLGAISRTRSIVAEVNSEDLPGEDQAPSENWPTHCSISFNKVFASFQ